MEIVHSTLGIYCRLGITSLDGKHQIRTRTDYSLTGNVSSRLEKPSLNWEDLALDTPTVSQLDWEQYTGNTNSALGTSTPGTPDLYRE